MNNLTKRYAHGVSQILFLEVASVHRVYDVTEKIGIVFGTFFFGFMEYMMDAIRASILSIIFFFVVGLILLFRVPRMASISALSRR